MKNQVLLDQISINTSEKFKYFLDKLGSQPIVRHEFIRLESSIYKSLVILYFSENLSCYLLSF